MEIKMKNDVLKHQGRYQGVYERSKIVNGKPSWNNSVHAIWYVSKTNLWLVGDLIDLGNYFGLKHNLYANPGLGRNLHLNRLTDNVWKYWNGSEWNTPGILERNDLIVSCKGT